MCAGEAEAITKASPIEGQDLPATVKVVFAARRTDTKADVGTLHYLPNHPSDILSADKERHRAGKVAIALAVTVTISIVVAVPNRAAVAEVSTMTLRVRCRRRG
jgi:hypothetical protein